MSGILSWSGDINDNASIILSNRKGAHVWTFKRSKDGPVYWSNTHSFKNKEEAFKELKIAAKKK